MSLADSPPEIPILLLGDAGVGKSTFLSYVSHGLHTARHTLLLPSLSPQTLIVDESRLTLGSSLQTPPNATLPTLYDLDQPFPFNIRLYNRPYRFEFSDTASPTNYTLLKPAVIILCYSIAEPETLHSLHTRWRLIVEKHFNYDESLPVIVLGLKRDVRAREEDYDGWVRRREREGGVVGEEGTEVLNGRTFVYPQEGLKVAQEMRCDRYCECSAMTGELCREVFEDIAKTAAMTTTEKGGKSQGADCRVM